MSDEKRPPEAVAWDELVESQQHLQTALHETTAFFLALVRFLRTLAAPRVPGEPPSPIRYAADLLEHLLDGAASGLARDNAPSKAAIRRAKAEALDTIIAVLADEVDHLDAQDEVTPAQKERRDALASIVRVLVKQRDSYATGAAEREDAADGPGKPPRVRRVPVD